MHKHDAARSYQEQKFDGRRELSSSVIIASLLWISDIFVPMEFRQEPIYNHPGLLIIPALLLYLIGFGKAIRSKGYEPAMFLLAFTGLIGLFILFILPNKNDSNDGT
ncbi:hypothetical protein LNTAR_05531 [Lentisphaera araneosa HTCC2155]|uniref:Uncharacterized protein n=1 Tax=Lentisphaera araneosa HTCC2155 TaxID=313628 RepID=A6DLU3_9BACT|nr:hypothetical protein [Lentisphaera araneosa]EDM27548.1 hypothetical protein LNTAR_05531 [Lentisphaera araneosa HTCC2155]